MMWWLILVCAGCVPTTKPGPPSGVSVRRFAEDPGVYHLDGGPPGRLVVGHDDGSDATDSVRTIDARGLIRTLVEGLDDPDAALWTHAELPASCGVGSLVVADGQRLRLYDEVGTLVREVSWEAGSNLQGMAISSTGRFLVADHTGHRLLTLDDACALQTFAELAPDHFPGDVAVVGEHLYVTDLDGPHGVVVLDAETGEQVGSIDGFTKPDGIAFDDVGRFDGDVLVAEQGGEVSRIDTETRTRSVLAVFETPVGVTVAPDGCLYVSVRGKGAVYQICPASGG